MYEVYFNLSERPFSSVPRIDHYHPASVIDSARNTLTRCVERAEGVALVIGPSGTGKSLLCQVLGQQFKKTFQMGLLAGAHLDTRRALLQAILYELGQAYRGMDEGELRLALVDYVTLNEACRHGIVLIVDEAQHLPLRLLDEIRSLTNLMRGMQPAVRLVLAGNAALEERFASPKLDSFSQRISARCYLEAFQRHETEAYLHARIRACGGDGAEIFPQVTCQMIHRATDGVPRLINQLCDHVLLLGFAAGIQRIEPVHVEEAWADLQQLPTPWNVPAASTQASDSLIEFGGLDDEPLETASLASTTLQSLRIAAATRFDGPEVVGEVAAGEDEQLREIQQLLADVQAEFLPIAAAQPEVELVFETPHPFREEFAEEEPINDRFAALSPPLVVGEPMPATAGRDAVATATAEPVNPTLPMPHGRTVPWADSVETLEPQIAVGDARTALFARSVVPPPRKEFGRLFATMRRGL